MAVEKLEIEHDGKMGFALKQADYINARALAAASVETVQAPAEARFVLFAATGDFYCKMAATSTDAAVPADVTNGSAAELNPTMRLIGDKRFISVIAPAECVVTLSYFK